MSSKVKSKQEEKKHQQDGPCGGCSQCGKVRGGCDCASGGAKRGKKAAKAVKGGKKAAKDIKGGERKRGK